MELLRIVIGNPMALLTFFHADFGKECPSRTLWRDPSRNCPSPSSVMCPLLYRTEHFSRAKKGVASKRGKKEERTRENKSDYIFGNWGSTAILWVCHLFWLDGIRKEFKRDKLNGTNGFLQNSAVFCENLRLRNAVIPRKKRKSAKICKKTANSAPFVPFSLSLLIPLDVWFHWWQIWCVAAFSEKRTGNITKRRLFASPYGPEIQTEFCPALNHFIQEITGTNLQF